MLDNIIGTAELATELTVAWLSNPSTRAAADDVPAFMKAVKSALDNLSSGRTENAATETVKAIPAVSVRKSLASDDHIISMIDGKSYKTLRRHLKTQGHTPESYRETFGLKPDYPMVAKNYSQRRSEMARRIGLGRKPAPEQSQASRKRGKTSTES